MTRALATLLLLVLVPSCTQVGPVTREPAPPAEPLVWPAPPDKPRIKLLYTFRVARDLGISKPFLRRLWDSIVGADAYPAGLT